MPNDTTVTVRVPGSLKRRLEQRARANHRSLSAQVLSDLASAVDGTPAGPASGPFLGLYAGSAVPDDDDIREVRTRLWSRVSAATPRA